MQLSNNQSHFWQWDVGQKIKIDDAAGELHYVGLDGSVPVGPDGWASVPDELLQHSGTLRGWAYLTDHTLERFSVGVSPRSKPPDYVYTPTEVKSWEELRDRLEELEKHGVSPDSIKGAVDQYLDDHPIQETDPTVPDWAKAPEKPTYTAGEVGAISADALQDATENALAQAKASGAFDGPKGDKGDPGEPGKDGAGLAVTGATAGQIVKIAAVDEAGKPTAWEPATYPDATWRLIRHVVIPDDITSDTSGVAFAEQANGGVTFAFDTDNSGGAFSVTELLVLSKAGTPHSNSSFTVSVDSATPHYTPVATVSMMLDIGKNGNLKESVSTSWIICWDQDTRKYVSRSEGATFGGGTWNGVSTGVRAYPQDMPWNIDFDGTIRRINCFMQNLAGYGFIAGSEFYFYGR